MITVKLSKYEVDLILECLNERFICETDCYCDYNTDMCNKLSEGGTYRCKLQQTIQKLENKLKGESV